jgi:hypothetical protein
MFSNKKGFFTVLALEKDVHRKPLKGGVGPAWKNYYVPP